MWLDDIGQWTMLKDYGEVKRSATVNLLIVNYWYMPHSR